MSRGVGTYTTAINYGYGLPLYGAGNEDNDDDDIETDSSGEDEPDLGFDAIRKKANGIGDMSDEQRQAMVEALVREGVKRPIVSELVVEQRNAPPTPPRNTRGAGRSRCGRTVRGYGRGGGRVFDPRTMQQSEEQNDPLDGLSLLNLFGSGYRKNSLAAKKHMAYVRSFRNRGVKKSATKGGSILAHLAPMYLRGVRQWFDDRRQYRDRQLAEIEKLKKIKGGKFDPQRDIVDILAGPIGWTMMGLRKRREKEIEDLKKSL